MMHRASSPRAERDAGGQQALDELAHGDDAFAERQRADAAEEQALQAVAAQRRGELGVDAELAPARKAVAQPALRQAVEGQRAARLAVSTGLQPRRHAEVLLEPGRAHRARRQPGDAGELDQVLGLRLGQHLLEHRVGIAFVGGDEGCAELGRGRAERLQARDVLEAADAAGGDDRHLAFDTGVALIVRKWERKKRLPDAIVIEHPRLAGGHLGAARVADLNDPRFDFERAIPESLDFLRKAGLEGQVPLIPAGGIRRCEDIAHLQSLGAAAVQLGTPFATTIECDASDPFKQVLAQARDEDIVEFTSVAGLPARAVRTPWLQHYLDVLPRLQAKAHKKPRCTMAFDCLAQCGLRDGLSGWGQFCIDTQLAAGLRGDLKKGLFFRGAGALPFGNRIVAVRELVERLLTPAVAAACA